MTSPTFKRELTNCLRGHNGQMLRDNFKESVKAALRERVAHRCSNPGCRVPTAAPGSGSTGVVRGGDAAHITAASPKGPRYDDGISAAKRSSIDNGIWLCVLCARKVDQDREAHPVEVLQAWKALAEKAAANELGKPLLADAQLHAQTQAMVAQQGSLQQQILATLHVVQAKLINAQAPNQLGVEPLDHLLEALRRLADSGETRGAAVMQLTGAGRYADAAEEAIQLAEDEARAATHLDEAAEETRRRAAVRWLDAGDIAFVTDRQQAADAYRRCTETDPSNPFGWSRLGEAAWWVGRLDTALNAFTRLWYLMPEGIETFAGGGAPPAVQQARFMRDHPDVPHETFVWTIRGVVIAGLNIVEILRREPSLITTWVIQLVPADRLDQRRHPIASEAPGVLRFFSERVYNLGRVISSSAAPAEHRRILQALAHVASSRGEIDESEEYLRRAHAMTIDPRDFVAEAVYWCNLGVIAAMRGQVNTAREYLDKCIGVCKGDSKLGRLFAGTNLITADEAAGLRQEHERKVASGTAVASPEVGEIEVCNLLANEFDRDPEAAMRKALVLKEAEGNAHGNLGLLAEAEGNIDLAQREFAESLRLHESIGCTVRTVAARAAIERLNRAATEPQSPPTSAQRGLPSQ